MALASAFDDPRFFPLKKEELPFLDIEISIVFPLKKIDDWRKIKLGEEGVLIGKAGCFFTPSSRRNRMEFGGVFGESFFIKSLFTKRFL